MTVSVQDTIFYHVGNGVTTVFAYNCQVYQSNDLYVYVDGVEITTGITKNGIGVASGGTVTFAVAPASGAIVILEREVALERTTDYQQNGDFLARVVNPDFNRIWMALQQLFSGLRRSITFPKNDVDPITELAPAAERANKLFSFDASGNPATVVPSEQSASALSILLYTPTGAGLLGFIHSILGSIFRTTLAKLRDEVSSKDLGIMSDNSTDDRAAWVLALERCAAAGRTIVVEDGVSLCSDWLPLPNGLKMRFKPNAQLKLTANTALGGFVCGGYDINLNPVAFTNVEIYGMNLDCNSIAGENGICAISGSNIKFHNPQVFNTRHSTVTLGGRAFQFEGGIVDGIHIFSPYIQGCSIGINSQGDPAGTQVVRNVNYHNVVMRNVDVPFNVDSQFANPETNTPYTMSTTVNGASLYDCGKLTFPGASSTVGGGIVCGDRGAGLRINDMRIVNSVAYGGIGALTRGVMFGVHLHNVEFYGPSMTAMYDFSQVGFGSSSAGTFASTVTTSGRIAAYGNLDYVAKAGPSSGRIGAAVLRAEINSTTASLTGLVDANGGTATTAMLEVILSDQTQKTTGMRTMKSLFDRGNTTALCFADGSDETGTWTPTDASGAGLALTVVAGTATWIKRSGWVTAKAQITYPATADATAAKLGGLPFTAINLGAFAGSGTFGYKTEATLTGAYVIGNTLTIQLSVASGGIITNATLSGDTMYITVTYQSV